MGRPGSPGHLVQRRHGGDPSRTAASHGRRNCISPTRSTPPGVKQVQANVVNREQNATSTFRERLRPPRLPADLDHRRSVPTAACRRSPPKPCKRRAPRDRGTFRRRSVRHDRGLHALRPLRHARHRRLRAARGLRQRQPHRAGARDGRDQLRDDSRHARHVHRWPSTCRARHPAAARRLARPLGGRRARRRDDEPDGSDEHRRQWQRPAPQRRR